MVNTPLTQNLIIKISYRRHTSGLEQEKWDIIMIFFFFFVLIDCFIETQVAMISVSHPTETRDCLVQKKNKRGLQRVEQCWKLLWFSALWCGRGTETGYRAITSDWLSPYSWRRLSTFPPNPGEKNGTHVERFSNGSDLKSAVSSSV